MTAIANDEVIISALDRHGPATVRRLARFLGADADSASADRVHGRMIQLMRQGRVERLGLPTLGAVYRPVRATSFSTRRRAA